MAPFFASVMAALMSDTPFSLKQIAVPAFGPSVLYGIANGAILPVIALTARGLEASVAMSGLIVALIGVGSLISNVPAALITSRFGEKRAIVGAALFSAVALLMCIFAVHLWMLGLGVLMVGMGSSVFGLARQAYLIEAVPLAMRARALSTLAGTMRIGVFIGPFAGAGLIYLMGLTGAYWVAVLAMFAAAWLGLTLPELVVRNRDALATTPLDSPPKLLDILRSHGKVFATLGVGALLVNALRGSRQVVIPLWADHLGLDPAAASLVYGLSAAIDMAVFYPAGKVMDVRGRIWVAIPSSLLMGLSLLVMPMATGVAAFLIVSLAIGLGNGIGSGIIMTLGADASPRQGRHAFLGIWRILADLGTSGGPLLLSAITALASLGIAISTTGLLGLVAAGVFWRWIPRKVDVAK